MLKTVRFMILAAMAASSLIYAAPNAAAQDAAAPESQAEAAATPAKDDADYDRRVKLATELHTLRPTKPQVYDAIDRVSTMQPQADRAAFVTAMRNILDYRAIEKISVDAMADTYTAEELEAMVEYYKQPAAQSAMTKEAAYGQKVYPEIIKLLDQAMIKVRAGDGSKKDAPKTDAPKE